MASRCDLIQQFWGRGPRCFRAGQFLEELRHGGRREDVQLLARVCRNHLEGVRGGPRNIDERSGWAVCLLILKEHQILTLEHVKRLGSITMKVEGRTELRWLTLRL